MIDAKIQNDLQTAANRTAEIENPKTIPPTEHILQFFEYGHLPPDLQEISRPFGLIARDVIMALPRNPERTVALRKLLEAKDAAVRSKVAK